MRWHRDEGSQVQAERRHFLTMVVEYDGLTRRLWIAGQRCHHGATGTVVAAIACLGLITGAGDAAKPSGARSMFALVLTGGALMAHDWKDHAVWFERGRGSQR